jgi:hypothetical protein
VGAAAAELRDQMPVTLNAPAPQMSAGQHPGAPTISDSTGRHRMVDRQERFVAS